MLYLHKSIEQHVEPRAELGCCLQWIDQRHRGRQNVQDDTEWVPSRLFVALFSSSAVKILIKSSLRENLNIFQEYIFRGLLSVQTILIHFNAEFGKMKLRKEIRKGLLDILE